MVKITVSKAKDKLGILPGMYFLNVNGKPIRRITGKSEALKTAKSARAVFKKRGKLPIGLR